MSNSQNYSQTWDKFIQSELKSNSNLGRLFKEAIYGGYENKTLILYFVDQTATKAAQGQAAKLKEKLKQQALLCDRIDFRVGNVPTAQPTSARQTNTSSSNFGRVGNPLQALNFAEFGQDRQGKELSQPVLEAAVNAEKSCNEIYTKLKQRTEQLAGEDGIVIPVSFNWRLRVGGTRGFRELLLPVFHPVFGIPYIPASSLKGATRAWASKQKDPSVQRLLGMLQGNIAKAAKVEFLDAFPTKQCLSVDVATPQWHWQANRVMYKPEPHPLLSMEQPQFLIGLRPTANGTAQDVRDVKEWLEKALQTGIGSRVSSGYGRALGQVPYLPYSQKYTFELWTQGMYGNEPPSRQNSWQGCPEFRPTAVRGILRYWFRAVALSLYDTQTAQTLEEDLFGKLSKQGKIAISVLFNKSSKTNPYFYTGTICLEGTEQKYLNLISQLLILASLLGGIGRGSRRPLHLLNERIRGCHWTVDSNDSPLEYDRNQWQQFFTRLTEAFKSVKSPVTSSANNLGNPKPRQHDLLNRNAQVWLLKSSDQIPPDKVRNWLTEGNLSSVRGTGLNLLYSSDRFKGKNMDGRGNPNVGGALETPSFVWIKSIFPHSNEAYQVVTIFGIDNSDRLEFAKALQAKNAELVFGQMPFAKQVSKPPQRR